MRKLQAWSFALVSVVLVAAAVANVPPPSLDAFRFEATKEHQDELRLQLDNSLPVPVVVKTMVERGKRDFSNETNLDDGYLWVRLALPDRVAIAMEDIGFQFRVVSGQVPRNLRIPKQAVRSVQISKDGSNFNFYWQDGGPEQHDPMDFVLEISIVTIDMRIGPPARLAVK
jgi:hypothetical protein